MYCSFASGLLLISELRWTTRGYIYSRWMLVYCKHQIASSSALLCQYFEILFSKKRKHPLFVFTVHLNIIKGKKKVPFRCPKSVGTLFNYILEFHETRTVNSCLHATQLRIRKNQHFFLQVNAVGGIPRQLTTYLLDPCFSKTYAKKWRRYPCACGEPNPRFKFAHDDGTIFFFYFCVRFSTTC